MIEHRRLRRSAPHDYRLYKASTDEELIELKEKFGKFFQRSVIIEDYGNIKEAHLRQFDNICDDYAFRQLELKLTDLFMLTKEHPLIKIEDEKKMNLIKKLPPKIHKVLPASSKWTEDQLKHLWHGKAGIVAKIVNKTADAVERKRREYCIEHPEFAYPEECKTPRKNAKVVVEVVKQPLSEIENKILWEHSPLELVELTKRNRFEIAKYRREYCQAHPEFVIPHVAKFNKGDLPNEVEKIQRNKVQKVEIQTPKVPRKPWAEENHELLWNNDSKVIEERLNKTSGAVYQARIIYLHKNPEFVIPKASNFRINSPVHNFRYEVDAIEQPKPVKTKVIEQKEPEPLEPKAKEQSKKDNFSELAELLNQLDTKPKKIKYNGIELEF